MLEAKCPKCGARYFGWALRDLRHQKCENCSAQLEVISQVKTQHDLLQRGEFSIGSTSI